MLVRYIRWEINLKGAMMSLRSSRLAAVSLVSVLGLGAGIYACKPRKFNSSVKSAGGVEIAYRIPEGQTWDQIYSDREKLYNGYLTAPDKKHKTMFNWYTEQPLGLNGVPWLVLRRKVRQQLQA